MKTSKATNTLTTKQQAIKDARNYKASCLVNSSIAKVNLKNLNRNKYMGSGLVVTVQDLSGRNVMEPTMLKDGLSDEAIKALLDNIDYTRNLILDLAGVKRA